jgi:hypothetical protein
MLYLANLSSNGNSSLGHSIVGAIAIDVNLPEFITIISHPSLRRVFQENSFRVVQKYYL